MKRFLLTSQMIYNQSIAKSLAGMLKKPFSESSVAYIITSHNAADPEEDKSWFVKNLNSLYNLGWKNFYIIDVAGSNGLPKNDWMSQIEQSDVIVMGGGSNYFLSYWLEKSGLMSILPKLLETKIYVGASAGSMLLQPKIVTSSNAIDLFKAGNWDIDLDNLGPEGRRSAKSLNLIDFMIRPHYTKDLDAILSEISDKFKTKLYALDDNSALEIIGDQVNVISEGEYKIFEPKA